MALIVPAILEKTPEAFLATYNKIVGISGLGRVHIDFCDGKFVPHASLSAADMPELDRSFHFEAHVMYQKFQDFQRLRDLGFSTIILHAESYEDPQSLREALQNISLLGLKSAVALSPETSAERLIEMNTVMGQITALSVHPGQQGSPFIPEVLDKIKALKHEFPDAILEIDGGMHKDTVAQATASGADLLVVGSDLLTASDIQSEFNVLAAIAESS